MLGALCRAAGAAHHRDALPDATRVAWSGHLGKVEMNIVCHYDVEFTVAVIVDEGAARAPFRSGACNSGLPGHLNEGAIALIVEEAVGAIRGDVDIIEAIIVVVSDARSLAPSCGNETGLRCYVGEGSVVIVMKEVVSGLLESAWRQAMLTR